MNDDDDLEGDVRRRIQDSVSKELSDFEKNRIPRALKHLQDMQKLAPEYAKTLRVLLDALKKEGFDDVAALEIVRDYVKVKGTVAY